jgi:hypothetical protein
MKYILFLFGKSDNQEVFVDKIAKFLSLSMKSDSVRFYFGESAAVFTFDTDLNLKNVTSNLDELFNKPEIIYFLLPYRTDNLSVKLDSITQTHLFGTDDDIITDNEFLKIIKDRIEKNLIFDEEEYEEDDLCLTNKVKEPLLDDILDKISYSGLSSLSEYEKKLLNEYSK